MEKAKPGGVTAEETVELLQPTHQEFRYVILYGFRRNLKPIEIFNECQKVYGKYAPTLVTIAKWYRRFQSGYFSVKDDTREGRPKSSTNDKIVALVKSKIDQDPTLRQEKIAEELGLNAMAVSRILKKNLRYKKQGTRWVPQKYSEDQK